MADEKEKTKENKDAKPSPTKKHKLGKVASWIVVLVMLFACYVVFFTDNQYPFDDDFKIPFISDIIETFNEFVPDLFDSDNIDKNKDNNKTSNINSYVPDNAQEDRDPIINSASTMEVHVIDVGQGSATLFVNDKKTILIDAGENGKGYDVVNYINSLGINYIDVFIGTHPHSDHIGGMDEVLEMIDVGTIIMPTLPVSITPTTKTYLDVLKMIDEKGKTITEANVGDVYEVGDMELKILGPVLAFKDLNNMSVISKVTFNDTSVIVTGDAEKEAENAVLANLYDIRAAIYIAGHHGSSTSNTVNFVKSINPKYTAISVGADNSYGHPHKETIETLNSLQIPFFRTDRNGSIVFIVDDNGRILVECEK